MKKATKLVSVMLAFFMVFTLCSINPAVKADTKNDVNSTKLLKQVRHLDSSRKAKLAGIAEQQAVYNEPVRLVVKLKARPAETAAGEAAVIAAQKSIQEQVLAITGGEIKNEMGYIVNSFSVTGARKDMREIAKIDGVASVQPAAIFTADMKNAVKMTGADLVWKAPYNLTGEGMVVSIVDTGVDSNSQDMGLDDPSKVALTETKVNSIIAANNLPGKYFTAKIPYGYNYADKTENPKALYGSSQHGMHVAGITGGNGTTKTDFRGVAPNAQLLAMKVFSNYEEGAWSDDIMHAIRDSVILGADVINMSLGSPGGFSTYDGVFGEVVKDATDKGTLVCIAAGNEGTQYDAQGYTYNPYGIVDSGLVGADSTHPDALSVAAVENTGITKFAFSWRANGQNEQIVAGSKQEEPKGGRTFKDGNWVETVYWDGSKADATLSDTSMLPDPTGKYVIIQRGFGQTFMDKATAAKKAGAIGIFVYDNKPGDGSFGMSGVEESGISSFFLPKAEGEKIVAKITATPAEKVEIKTAKAMTVTSTVGADFVPCSFTSWGPTPELCFKPEIAAPGGNIFSTMNDNNYDNMSGTSMATPHMSGLAALYMQKLKKDNPNISGREKSIGTKNVFMNTAKPIEDKANGSNYSVRRVGSGMANVKCALDTEVTLANKADGRAAVELKDKIAPFKVVLTNHGDADRKYKVKPSPVYMDSQVGDEYATVSPAQISCDKTEITVPANGKVEVTFMISDFSKVEKNFIEGNILFEAQDADEPNLTMPYLGYTGNWGQDFDIVDNLLGTESKSGSGEYVSLLSTVFDPGTLRGRALGLAAQTGLVSYNPLLADMIGLNDAPMSNVFDWIFDGVTYKYEKVGFNNSAAFDPEEKQEMSDNGNYTDVAPRIGFRRGAVNAKFEIQDASGKTIRTLGITNNQRKIILSKIASGRAEPVYGEYAWDGTFYNEKDGEFELAPEGNYYYVIKTNMGEGYEDKETKMPVMVDNTAPVLKGADTYTYDAANDVATLSYTDVSDGDGTGIDVSDYSMATTFDGGETIKGIDYTNDGEFTYDEATKTITAKLYNLKKNYANGGAIPDLVFAIHDYAGNWRERLVKADTQAQTDLTDKVKIALKNNDTDVLAHDGMFVVNKEFNEKDGHAKPAFAVTADGASILKFYIDGTEVAFKDGLYMLDTLTEGVHDLKAEATIGGATVSKELKLLYDITPPVVTLDKTIKKADSNVTYIKNTSSDPLVVNAKYEDNLSPNVKAVVTNGVKAIQGVNETDEFASGDSDDYTFEYNYNYASFSATDSVGNTSDPQIFVALKADDDPENIPNPKEFGIPADVVITAPEELQYLIGDGYANYRGEESDADSTEITLEGKVRYNIKKLTIDGAEVTIDPTNLTFKHKITVKRGVNYYNYTTYDHNGDEIKNTQLRIFFDNSLPKIDFATDPAYKAGNFDYSNANGVEEPGNGTELVIFTKNDTEPVKLTGTVSDNEFGYRVYVNGDKVAEAAEYDEGGAKKVKEPKAFAKDIEMKNLDFIRLEYYDVIDFGNDATFAQKIQLQKDDKAPEIRKATAEDPDGNPVELVENKTIMVKGKATLFADDYEDDKDVNPNRVILLDGEPYDGDPIDFGTHSVTVTVKDAAGNTTTKRYNLIVYSEPEIDVSDVPVEYEVGSIEELKAILGATLKQAKAADAYDGDLTSKLVATYEEPQSLPAEFTVYYKVVNSFGKITEKSIKVKVAPRKVEPQKVPPTIKASNCKVMQGSTFDPMFGVSAYDYLGKNIKNLVKVEGSVDTSKPGTYRLVYTVIDDYGIKSFITREVTVVAKPHVTPKPNTTKPGNSLPVPPATGEASPVIPVLMMLMFGVLTLIVRKQSLDK